jgi:hypothetical protein
MFNSTMLERLPGTESIYLTKHKPTILTGTGTYYSFGSIKEQDQPLPTDHSARTPEYLSLQHESGIPTHDLKLKRGCICTIMRNLDINESLVKNRRIMVQNLHDKVIDICLIDSTSPHRTFYLPRITFEFQPHRCPWTIQRRQFPLRLAYATTFNSCQGLTLNKVVLDLRSSVFSHGQLYCSVSRVRHRGSCRKLMAEENCSGKARNVVYRQIVLPDRI